MMQLIAAHTRPAPVRAAPQLIATAKIETRWLFVEGLPPADDSAYATVRAMLVAQWRAARSGELAAPHFYSTARSIANALALLIAIRRARAVRQ